MLLLVVLAGPLWLGRHVHRPPPPPRAQVLVAVAAVAWNWQQPIAAMPPRWLWPVNRLLAAPHGALGFATAGLVAAGPYCYLCIRASRALTQGLLPPGG